MKKYEKQITVSEEFYEISKEELEKIKKERELEVGLNLLIISYSVTRIIYLK